MLTKSSVSINFQSLAVTSLTAPSKTSSLHLRLKMALTTWKWSNRIACHHTLKQWLTLLQQVASGHQRLLRTRQSQCLKTVRMRFKWRLSTSISSKTCYSLLKRISCTHKLYHTVAIAVKDRLVEGKSVIIRFRTPTEHKFRSSHSASTTLYISRELHITIRGWDPFLRIDLSLQCSRIVGKGLNPSSSGSTCSRTSISIR